MGTPIVTPEPPYGTDCPICTPTLFPAGETPEFVYVYISGITDCGRSHHSPPNGETFRCTQVPGSPCVWYNDGDIWKVTFQAKRIGFDYSWLTVFDHDGWSFFNGTSVVCPDDLTIFDNDQAACILMYAGASGNCIISYTDLVAWLVAQFGFVPGPNLMQELFCHSDGDVIIKFTDIVQSTNIRFKMSS